ncbi:MAG TPA: CDP-alcohol phosphatidyltransferase family protein [Candidatus Kapabacteria bacterium]|nr:CDP-alcohol phosphatidyltransferase family protein [Candidatus Kapabacteria bacterium]
MRRINYFVQNHPDLFTYLPADHVHPHDHFIARTFLRFLPDSVTPNRITMFRILMTPFVFALIMTGHYKIGMVAFLLVAFTDALDGSLARTKNMITRFGILFDPLADKFLIGSMVLLLVFQYFPVWLGFTILGLEIIFILSAYISNVRFKTVRMANVWGKIKMVLQVLAVFSTLGALVFNFPLLLTVATGLFGLAIGFAIVSLFAHGI